MRGSTLPCSSDEEIPKEVRYEYPSEPGEPTVPKLRIHTKYVIMYKNTAITQ